MNEILTSLQTLLVDHLSTTETLTEDMVASSKEAKVGNTSRFRAGDDVFLMSTALNKAEKAQVFEVTDWETLTLVTATTPGWTTANNSFVQKAFGYQPLKRVYIGDLRRIPDFPTITIAPVSESNEWWSLRATEHDFKIAIRVYVQTHNFEQSNIAMTKYAQAVREILLDHIHPVISSQTEFHALTVDLPPNSTIVSIADTSDFQVNGMILLRDAQARSEEATIRSIPSPTELEVGKPTALEFLVARQGEVLLINRYLYDTRPSEINYGYVPGAGGSMLRAAEIQWYGKEVRCREGNLNT